MPAPRVLHAALLDRIKDSLEPLIDTVWDASAAATRADMLRVLGAQTEPPNHLVPLPAPPPASPQKRGAANRLGRGRVKAAVHTIIQAEHDRGGATREEIRRKAPAFLGVPIKEGSLKQALRLLRKEKKIETRNSRWRVRSNQD